jgi:hypothetical protein
MNKTKILLLIIIILSCVIIRYYIAHQIIKEKFDQQEPKNIELVISRYNEQINWLDDKPFNKYKSICYNKGNTLPQYSNTNCKFNALPNVGRCDHTFLYHIINNYDKLADVTIFLPASWTDVHKVNTTLKLMELVDKSQTTVLLGKKYSDVRKELGDFYMDTHVATSKINQEVNPETKLQPCPIRPYGKWYDTHFNDLKINVVCFFGVFAVAREHIIQHPKSHYETLIKYVDNHSNPEAGHYMERSWAAIFHPYPPTCVYDARDVHPSYLNYRSRWA